MSFTPPPSPFRETALALLDAEEQDNQAGALRKALIEHGINPKFLIDLVAVTVGVLAFQADETPRTVYEQLFANCPDDADWRKMIETWDGDLG